MTTTIIAAFVLTSSLIVYYYLTTERAHDAALQITSSAKFGYYMDLCRMHGLRLDIAELPDKDGDESFRTFTFSRGNVTRTFGPSKTLKVLEILEVGDTDRALAVLKMAQA